MATKFQYSSFEDLRKADPGLGVAGSVTSESLEDFYQSVFRSLDPKLLDSSSVIPTLAILLSKVPEPLLSVGVNTLAEVTERASIPIFVRFAVPPFLRASPELLRILKERGALDEASIKKHLQDQHLNEQVSRLEDTFSGEDKAGRKAGWFDPDSGLIHRSGENCHVKMPKHLNAQPLSLLFENHQEALAQGHVKIHSACIPELRLGHEVKVMRTGPEVPKPLTNLTKVGDAETQKLLLYVFHLAEAEMRGDPGHGLEGRASRLHDAIAESIMSEPEVIGRLLNDTVKGVAVPDSSLSGDEHDKAQNEFVKQIEPFLSALLFSHEVRHPGAIPAFFEDWLDQLLNSSWIPVGLKDWLKTTRHDLGHKQSRDQKVDWSTFTNVWGWVIGFILFMFFLIGIAGGWVAIAAISGLLLSVLLLTGFGDFAYKNPATGFTVVLAGLVIGAAGFALGYAGLTATGILGGLFWGIVKIYQIFMEPYSVTMRDLAELNIALMMMWGGRLLVVTLDYLIPGNRASVKRQVTVENIPDNIRMRAITMGLGVSVVGTIANLWGLTLGLYHSVAVGFLAVGVWALIMLVEMMNKFPYLMTMKGRQRWFAFTTLLVALTFGGTVGLSVIYGYLYERKEARTLEDENAKRLKLRAEICQERRLRLAEIEKQDGLRQGRTCELHPEAFPCSCSAALPSSVLKEHPELAFADK